MLQAEFNQRRQMGIDALLQQGGHARVDIVAISLDLGQRRSREQAALSARMLGADAVVIRVEDDPEGRVERRKTLFARFENERLEEPGGMRQVPFDRAGVGHRLRTTILVGQPVGQVQRPPAHLGEQAWQAFVAQHIHCAIAWAWMTANQRCGSVQTRVASKPERSSS